MPISEQLDKENRENIIIELYTKFRSKKPDVISNTATY